MVLRVSDAASHRRDQIANLAELLAGAPTRQALVKAVCFGKKRNKSVVSLGDTLGITPKRVTEIGKPLVNLFFTQDRIKDDGRIITAYVKDDFIQHNLKKILQLANNKQRLSRYHTKTNPKISAAGPIRVSIPFRPRVDSITVDDVSEFVRVRSIRKAPPTLSPRRLAEKVVKKGIIRLLGDEIDPKDWGGESNDIFTTRITVKGKRRRAAFALKGPAVKGALVPKMMGTNGDQIPRLFTSPAQVFIVQYEGEIKESIVSLLANLALAKAVTEREVFYGVIDLQDTYRLRLAYPKAFRN